MKFTLYPPQAIYELGQRQNQEDAIFPKIGEATNRDRLFVLCDGMGGHEKGEVASNTISQALAEYLDKNASADAVVSDDTLLAALEYAYQQLDAKDDGAAKKMGTTLCLLLFHRGGLTAMHIGDSRIYHIRPSEHRIVYQSKDHSLVYDLYQAGEITFDEMRTSPQKNIITRAIQPGEDNRVRPAIVHITDIKPGDYFYICSDGMLEQMENEELCNLLSAKGSDEKKRQQLIASTADNKDNHSAYLIHINKVEHEQGDENLLDDEQTTPDNAINIKPRVEETEDVSVEDDRDVVEVSPSDVEAVQPSSPTKNNKRDRKKLMIALIGVAVLLVIAILAAKSLFSNKERQMTEKDGVLIERIDTSNPAKQKVRRDTQRMKPIVQPKPVQKQDDIKPEPTPKQQEPAETDKAKETEGNDKVNNTAKQSQKDKSNAKKMADKLNKLKKAEQKQKEQKSTNQTKDNQDQSV